MKIETQAKNNTESILFLINFFMIIKFFGERPL